ncbi:MAG: tetratricopeptide repeat protein [Armatimonadota bacterium]|nr:tetratricopeptide repeat protein [Armatimonadota bacterium]MDR7449659.1 tetratricopeptide repeat protein [Armatimonadota bacterium]MDR7460572.1 tetratricopeptide repeat protein [Armatimonadota bacterium]MDR7480810.1 tetratricopeptide repeat protein [Armatimonadota bacterium]MDR7489014.1 tetratricopeptide repeat protein [Armatimonadota bacterium]
MHTAPSAARDPGAPGGWSLALALQVVAFAAVAVLLVIGPRGTSLLTRTLEGADLFLTTALERGDGPEVRIAPPVIREPAALPMSQRVERQVPQDTPAAHRPSTGPASMASPPPARARKPAAAPSATAGRSASAHRSTRQAPAATPTAATLSPTQRRFQALMVDGRVLFRAGWFGPAVGRFRQATRLMPSDPEAWLWLGRAAFMAERHDEAREALRRAAALAPGTAFARDAATLLAQLP